MTASFFKNICLGHREIDNLHAGKTQAQHQYSRLKYSTVLKFHVTLPAQPVPPLTLALTGATGKIASKKHRNREVHKILNNLPESISTQARLGYM